MLNGCWLDGWKDGWMGGWMDKSQGLTDSPIFALVPSKTILKNNVTYTHI